MIDADNKDLFGFVQMYCFYLKRNQFNDPERGNEFDKDIKEFFDEAAPFTCIQCNHKTGLSFIESKHQCSNPLFDPDGIPIKQRVIEECKFRGLDFERIYNSVTIKNLK